MANAYIIGLVRFIHDFSTAIWIGGLTFMVIVLLPGIKRFFEEEEKREKFLHDITKPLKIIVRISILLLIITGILMSRFSPNYTSAFSFANEYSIMLSIKHILTILMVCIVIAKTVVDKLKTQTTITMKLSKIFIIINFSLGVVVLLLSGFTSAIGSIPIP